MIEYVVGDATNPLGKGNKIIAHICNDVGGWGKGFVLAISKKWKEPEQSYRQWYHSKDHFGLGKIKVVPVNNYMSVANMVAQKGIRTGSKGPPIRYEALEQCLELLAEEAKAQGASVHMPRIGCGLAGGKWELIEPLIEKTLISQGISVTVYDFR